MTLNDRAARQTARWVLENPDIAEPVLAMAVYNQVQQDFAIHKAAFQQTLDSWADRMVAKMGPALRGELISKVRAGEDTQGVELAWQALQVIAKAQPQDSWELSARAKRQARDSGGRFRTMGRKIQPHAEKDRPGFQSTPQERARARQAQVKGSPLNDDGSPVINPLPDGAGGRQFAAEYAQIQSAVQEAAGRGEVRGVRLLSSDGRALEDSLDEDGDLTVYPSSDLAADPLFRVTGVEVTYDPDLAIGASGADILGALGGAGAKSRGAAAGSLYQAWNNEGTRSTASEPRRQAYNRVASAADVVDVMTPNKTPEAKLALVAGKWAARHGQDIENAVGPTAEKATYRYRAIEKQPDRGLQGKLEALRGDRLRETVASTGTDRGAGAKARYHFVMGAEGRDRPGGWEEAGLSSPWRGKAPVLSPVRDYLTDKLPDPKRVDLHRRSGRATPSQGIIIDSQGRITTESVGMGEDHYLPFTLAALKGIKGGEYARTRAWGGPTTEDFYTSMITGGRAFTVVSNHGTFHVEFDPSFKGSRRYSDKTARMIKTYAGYLDTLEGAEARMGMISGSRKKELDEKARKLYPTSAEQRTKYRDKLVEDELRSPKLSAQEKVKVLNDLLEEQALVRDTAAGRRKEPGVPLSVDEMKQSVIDQIAATRGPNAAEIAVKDWQEHPEKLAQEFGIRSKFDRAVQDEEDAKAKEVGRLRLDGTGYAQALEAMKEQFPYFIKSVEYRPANENVQDEYYVRPGDTRPAGVEIGYQNAPNSARAGKTSAASLYGKQGSRQTERRESKLKEARSEATQAKAKETAERATRQKVREEGLPEPERTPTPAEVVALMSKKGEAILEKVPPDQKDAWANAYGVLKERADAALQATDPTTKEATGRSLQEALDQWEPAMQQLSGIDDFRSYHAHLSVLASENRGLGGRKPFTPEWALSVFAGMGDPGSTKFQEAIEAVPLRILPPEGQGKNPYLEENPSVSQAEYVMAMTSQVDKISIFAGNNADYLDIPEGGEFVDQAAADPTTSAKQNISLLVMAAKDYQSRAEMSTTDLAQKARLTKKRDADLGMAYLLSEYVRLDALRRRAPETIVVPQEELEGDMTLEERAARLKQGVQARAGGPADGATPPGFDLRA